MHDHRAEFAKAPPQANIQSEIQTGLFIDALNRDPVTQSGTVIAETGKGYDDMPISIGRELIDHVDKSVFETAVV